MNRLEVHKQHRRAILVKVSLYRLNVQRAAVPRSVLGVWIRVDGGAICSHLGLKQNTLSLGRVVDLVGGETDGPFRRSLEDYVQFPTSPLTHSAYAFTWCAYCRVFALCFVVTVAPPISGSR